MQENIDFSFVCKYCNKLYEISLSDLDREIIDLILKVKLNQSKNLAKSVINNNLSTSQSTIFSENPQSMDDMDAVKVDRISVSDIITNIDIIINNKTCHLCYKKLSKLNEEEINNINAEIKKIEKMKKILTKEIESNKDEIRDEEKEEKKEDAKAQEEASKRLIEDNIKLQKEFDKNIEILKNINEEEKKILDEVNKLNLDTLHI